ncbi:hypothetical protein [Nocardioides sp. CFH 31398]|uniref:hypothetical protein n=1 Tax=Nocardioides sp. CFH 31398 TaxID=2919579 RepID=UPI001F0574AD|nr:hypothetical protein [Nocardioides sp. CFH 31398]MCH1865591.1 hypothetical protein [Nocardioides sp. CFH 31398]
MTILEVPAGDAPAMHGFGTAGVKPWLWFVAGGRVGDDVHLALTADTREEAEVFHAAALAAGADEILPPAVHPEYHADYYGGFVRDPLGINLEAVCHHPPRTGRAARGHGPDRVIDPTP